MKKLSQDQFYKIMPIINNHLSELNSYLYYEYGFSLKLESKLEDLKNSIKKDLQALTDSDDE